MNFNFSPGAFNPLVAEEGKETISFGDAMGIPRIDLGKEEDSSGSDFDKLLNLFRDPAYRQGVMQDTLDFQKQQMAEAGKYKALFGLPQQIMNAFTIPAAIAATGDIAAANTLATAGANMGSMYTKVQPMQVGIPTVNYGFSK